MQDCSNSSASAMELLQSCTKPPILHTMTKAERTLNSPKTTHISPSWVSYGVSVVSTVEPFWKGQECLTSCKFVPFPCTIIYKSCLFYPLWQATSLERPPFWVVFIREGFHFILERADCYNCIAPVFKTKTSNSVQELQLWVKTSNFLYIFLINH